MRQKTDHEPSALTLNFQEGDLLYGIREDRGTARQEIEEYQAEHEPYSVTDFGTVDLYNNSIGILDGVVLYDEIEKSFVDNTQNFKKTYNKQHTTLLQVENQAQREERGIPEFEKKYQSTITDKESHNVNKMKQLLSDSEEQRNWRLHRDEGEGLDISEQLYCKQIRSLCKDGIDFARTNNKKIHFIVPSLDDHDAWASILFKTTLHRRYLNYLPITTSEVRYAIKLALKDKGEHIIFYDRSKKPMTVIETKDILEKFHNYKKHEDFILRDKNMEIFNQTIINSGILGPVRLIETANKFRKNAANFIRIEEKLRYLADKNISSKLQELCVKIKTCDASLDLKKTLNDIFTPRIQSTDSTTPVSRDISGSGSISQSDSLRGEVSGEDMQRESAETTLTFKKSLSDFKDDPQAVNDESVQNISTNTLD